MFRTTFPGPDSIHSVWRRNSGRTCPGFVVNVVVGAVVCVLALVGCRSETDQTPRDEPKAIAPPESAVQPAVDGVRETDDHTAVVRPAVDGRDRDSVTFLRWWQSTEASLQQDPNDHATRRILIDALLNHGLNDRAVGHATWLVRAGQGDLQTLLLLSNRRDFAGSKAVGPLGHARRYATRGDFDAALDSMGENDPIHRLPEARAMRMRIFADAQYDERLWRQLAAELVDGAAGSHSAADIRGDAFTQLSVSADFWSAVGLGSLRRGQPELAVRCLLAAIDRDPTRIADYRNLRLAMNAVGQLQSDASEFFASRGPGGAPPPNESVDARPGQLDQAIRLANMQTRPLPADFVRELSDLLIELGRPIEGLAWLGWHLGKSTNPTSADRDMMRTLSQRRRQMLSDPEFVAMSMDYRRMGLDRGRYPQPSVDEIVQAIDLFSIDLQTAPADRLASDPVANPASPQSAIAFTNVAQSWGVDFRYQNAPRPIERRFRLFESLGSGIGAIDFDRDGNTDLLFSQGSGSPAYGGEVSRPGEQSDRFFRNVAGRMIDITAASGVTDSAYGHGVATGDINSDGWPDVIVANLGRNRWLINRGDGTFNDAMPDVDPARFTASIAIADITGDAIAEVVAANYVDDQTMFEPRIADVAGIPPALSPTHYRAASDSVYSFDVDGSIRRSELENDHGGPSHSLAATIGGFDSVMGNEVHVAVDVGPDRVWKMIDNSTVNVAELMGLDRNATGVSTGSMGVAIADFDGDHRPDIAVTNFARESTSLFIAGDGGWADRSPAMGLTAATLDQVSFGVVAADFDADGDNDLAVQNGHIEDYRALGETFRARPQILRRDLVDGGAKLRPVAASELGDYFDRPALGRSMLGCDLNNDGAIDLVATHLNDPAALLLSQVRPASWIAIDLVGVICHRDAVGARVRIIDDERSLAPAAWRIAGGYMIGGDGTLTFAIKRPIDRVDVVVDWPDGVTTRHPNLATNERHTIVQSVKE